MRCFYKGTSQVLPSDGSLVFYVQEICESFLSTDFGILKVLSSQNDDLVSIILLLYDFFEQWVKISRGLKFAHLGALICYVGRSECSSGYARAEDKQEIAILDEDTFFLQRVHLILVRFGRHLSPRSFDPE